jgi:hypothetical protein
MSVPVSSVGNAPPQSASRRRLPFEAALAGLVALAAAASAMVWPRVAPVSPDSCEYLIGGLSLFAGRGYVDHGGNVQTLFPPFYSLLIGAPASFGFNPIVTARLLTLLASALTIVPLGLLTRRLFGAAAALATCLFFALLPLRLQISTMVWSESVYLLLLVLAVWLWAIEREKPSRLRAAAVGLSLGLAYLTRPEGLVSALVLLAFGVYGFGLWRRARLSSLAVCAATLIAVTLPWVIFVHAQTGRWTISPKADMNWRIGIIRSYDGAWELANTLNADATAPDLAMVTETPARFARRYAHNVRVTADSAMATFGPFLVVCSLLGLAISAASRDRRLAAALPALATLGATLPLLPALFIEDRYTFLAASPLLIIGSWQLTMRFRPALVAVAIALLFGVSNLAATLVRQGPTEGDPQLGAWLSGYVRPGETIMSNNQPAVYYADRRWIRLPYEGLDRTLIHARATHTAYVAISTRDYATSDLHRLSTGELTSPSLEPVATRDIGRGDRIILFRLK